jgi:predicted PurR-regulated permease PerM
MRPPQGYTPLIRLVGLIAAAIVVVAEQPTALALDRYLPGTPRPDVASASAVALLFATTLAIVTASLAEEWGRVVRLAKATEERSGES